MAPSAPTATSVRIRRATPGDAAACGAICYEAFATIGRQHGFPPDFPDSAIAVGLLSWFFQDPQFYCVVAESDGAVVGSNCLDERSTIAGVGPITVAPHVQNASVGRLLMQAVLDRARERGFPGVRLLQAAFHSRSLSLYAKLGFDAREPMSVMQGPAMKRAIDGHVVRTATESDVEAATRVCHRVHGHGRAGELRGAIAHGTARVVERHGRITGYASDLSFMGHAVAESDVDMQALIAAAEGFGGPGLIVPTRNASLFRWCLNNGLRVVQPLTLMTIGLYNEPQGTYLPSILY